MSIPAVAGNSPAVVSSRPSLVPTPSSGDQFSASAPPDPSLAAAQQLKAQNPLAAISTKLIPMGTHKYDASAKIAIITKHLGSATVTRTDNEIDVDAGNGSSKVHVAITDDPKNPKAVDVSAPGQKYVATIQPQNGGFSAKADGKDLTVTPNGQGLAVQATGFPQIPSFAKVILTPA